MKFQNTKLVHILLNVALKPLSSWFSCNCVMTKLDYFVQLHPLSFILIVLGLLWENNDIWERFIQRKKEFDDRKLDI